MIQRMHPQKSGSGYSSGHETLYASNAIRYTGRFQVKFAEQARQMRKSHPDVRYFAVILQYVKFFAVAFKQHTLLLPVDDKAIAPVGEPGDPISTGVRGHHECVQVDQPLPH